MEVGKPTRATVFDFECLKPQASIEVFSWGMPRGIRSDQIRSVAQSCPTLCDPMNCSMPGLPVMLTNFHVLPPTFYTHTHTHTSITLAVL